MSLQSIPIEPPFRVGAGASTPRRHRATGGEGAPSRRRPVPRTEGSPAERRANQPPRVLVVDDNVDLAESLVTVLQIEGLEAFAAFDARSAEELARSEQPTVVVSDLDMPLRDGYELARRLHASSDTRGIPVVAVSGWGDELTDAQAREAGFAGFLAKPFFPSELVEALRQLLGRRRSDH